MDAPPKDIETADKVRRAQAEQFQNYVLCTLVNELRGLKEVILQRGALTEPQQGK